MFKVYYINFDYYGNEDKPFVSHHDAIAYAKSKGFQASIIDTRDNSVVATWCPIGGTRYTQGYVSI